MAAGGDLINLGDDAPTEAVSQLQQMFPTIDRAVITSVYEEVADKELDKAIETLLQISDDSLDPASIAEGAQVSADEVMAMQILQEIMDKEDAATGGDADKVFRRIQSDQVDNERFKKQPKGVKEAMVRRLEKMKQKASGLKGGPGAVRAPEYKQHYASLLDEDEGMKV